MERTNGKTESRSSQRFRVSLVVAQIAMALVVLVVLVGAALLGWSFRALQQVKPDSSRARIDGAVRSTLGGPNDPNDPLPHAEYGATMSGFFHAPRIPLIAGRDFTWIRWLRCASSYSDRMLATGSVREARRAGMTVAPTATMVRAAVAPANAAASSG
jgi:hypothetical protein